MAGQNPALEYTNDQPPTDFVAHLEQRLGLETGEVTSTLAAWITSYQPGPLALAQSSSMLRIQSALGR